MRVWELESVDADRKSVMYTVMGKVAYDPSLDSFMLNFATVISTTAILEYHMNKLRRIRDENSDSRQ